MEKKQHSFFLNKKLDKADNKVKPSKLNKRQEGYDKNRDVKPPKPHENKQNGAMEKKGGDKEKKPFDKKTYRLKKYSKKYKLEQWEEQRKKRLIKNYENEIKNDTAGTYKPISFDEDTTDSKEVGKYVRHPDIIEKENLAVIAKRDPLKKAKDQYNMIKKDKEQKRLEIERVKEERKQKLLEYKKQKQERFKKLCKKNKRGQPMMSGRLELLLDKIQKSK